MWVTGAAASPAFPPVTPARLTSAAFGFDRGIVPGGWSLPD
jgi:hypothetical protein